VHVHSPLTTLTPGNLRRDETKFLVSAESHSCVLGPASCRSACTTCAFATVGSTAQNNGECVLINTSTGLLPRISHDWYRKKVLTIHSPLPKARTHEGSCCTSFGALTWYRSPQLRQWSTPADPQSGKCRWGPNGCSTC
jgi:hypothetical protein